MSEEVKSAANSYKKNFTTSGDPLYKLVGKIGSVAGTAGGTAANRMRDWWRSWSGRRVEHVTSAGGRPRRPG